MKNETASKIKENFDRVQGQIFRAAAKSGRAHDSVNLVVVSKTHDLSTIEAAIEAGVHNLGENYAEEAVTKITALGPISDLRWHMIGHIQSRKAELISRYFDYVHTIDSIKLANRLNLFAGEQKRKMPVLIECNVSGEDSKFGYYAVDETSWMNLLPEFNQISLLPNLIIQGLMTMPPLFDNPEKSRHYFQMLRNLRNYLVEKIPYTSWTELSMGTSSDYLVAIEEGATIVRIGTAILGSRPAK